jgi:hypothetical protein
MDDKNKIPNIKDSVEKDVYGNLFLDSLDTISGEFDNTSKNLFLSLNLDKVKKHVKNKENR